MDWTMKKEKKALFWEDNVGVVINADKTFVPFYMQANYLIVPPGIKRVGAATQVENEKM